MLLKSEFFVGDVLKIAPELLGKVLVKRDGATDIRMVINEVEAYDGESDKACHASRGRTPRTEVMYGPAGHWYVYLVYGMHYMLNIVTGEIGYPSAVLIRGTFEVSGPGRLSKALGVDMSFNSKESSGTTGLWIEDGYNISSSCKVEATERVGVDYADEWAKKPYRFLLKDHLVS